ncbi:MAG: TetR/AcrR family transcriptional regulator, partial [Treponema sp.]|nr:TetR/AcrR family transcriptional regulator [Treponema sp.]
MVRIEVMEEQSPEKNESPGNPKGGVPIRIMDTALDLFSRRGYEGTGIQEIVDGAGITKPALYHHFGNKEGLLGAIVSSYGRQYTGALAEAAVYRHDLV